MKRGVEYGMCCFAGVFEYYNVVTLSTLPVSQDCESPVNID